MLKKPNISIVVPVLNEADNLAELVSRIQKALHTNYQYEIIVIDDFSTDQTETVARTLATDYPVRYFLKKGRVGKAQSLLEGFALAQYENIAMIDSDLQYPPEVLPEMMKKLTEGFDVVVTRRRSPDTSFMRKLASSVFNYIFCKILHGLDHDVQSGLKVFRKEIVERITIHPLPWTFDMEFLIAARSGGYKITDVDITFSKRRKGTSKVNLLMTSLQIGLSALLLKLTPKPAIPFNKKKSESVGQGFNLKSVEFIHFSDLNITESAVHTFLSHQILFIVGFFLILLIGFFLNWIITLIILVSVITVLYFGDLVFNLFLIFRSFIKSPEITVSDEEIAAHDEWPMYTIFCPLYKEWRVVDQFVQAISQLDYPKEKLQVQMLLEADDTETIKRVKDKKLPPYFEMVIVPDTLPKTKPKACNYGLRFAKGEYSVIYDAEDKPDPLQLKKAVIAFERLGKKVACIQAKLNYYNRSQNLLTRLFTAEYSLWFDLILPGLQSLNAPIPLGGTSNHFRVAQLREVKGWDSFNVTEDCDLGVRLGWRGYSTAIVDSVTLEEANSDMANWLNQRSRWIKGYMQTYLVHMRYPMKFLKKGNLTQFMNFQVIVGGKILSLFINPFMWITTILYFSMRATLGPSIEKLFPPAIFYLAVFSLVVGNFLYMYYYMIGCVKRKQFDLVKFIYLIPFYWLAMSIAAWKAVYQLLFMPHYWPKTIHGLHLGYDTKQEESPVISKKEQVFATRFMYFQSLINIAKLKFSKVFVDNPITSGGVLVAALVVSNILNFFFSTYFGRNLNYEDFGVLTLVNTLSFLITLIFAALGTTVNARVAYLTGQYSKSHAAEFMKRTFKRVLIVVGIFALVWLALTPVLIHYFNLNGPLPILVLIVIILFGVISSMNEGYLSGSFQFSTIAVLLLIVPILKIGFGLALEATDNQQYIFLAIPLSILVPVTISSLFVFFRIRKLPKIDGPKKYVFPGIFYLSSLLSMFSISAYISMDILLVQHYLPHVAGKYAVLSLIGKIIFFFGSLFDRFIVPFVSRAEGKHSNPNRIFFIIFGATAFMTTIVFLGIGVFGKYTAPILFGSKVSDIEPYLLMYSVAIAATTLSNTILMYHLARKHYSFSFFAILSTLCMIVGVNLYHGSIHDITYVLCITSVGMLFGMFALHFVQQNGKFLIKNFIDFACLFIPISASDDQATYKKRILIYNWRDTRHMYAGGSEVYIHELAKRWVASGYRVVQFCGNDSQSPRNEIIDGVQIIRRGGFYMVYIWAVVYYMFRFKGKFDIVIDCENGIPFFTPLFVDEKNYLLIHHVHQDVFRQSLALPFAILATFLEIKLMPYIYRKTELITVSESSKQEILRSGITTRDPNIVYNGVDLSKFKPGTKAKTPLITYVGRLKKYKSVPVFIRAARQVLEVCPTARFVIAGDGEERPELEALVKSLGIEKYVEFKGFVTEREKIALYQKSWIFVQPSFMEGWSLTTIEANACGTPVIASYVSGLCDSVQDNVSGYLVEYGNDELFAKRIVELIKNNALRTRFAKQALVWASLFQWDTSAANALDIIDPDHK